MTEGGKLVEQSFDWNETLPSAAVAYALASLDNQEIDDLPPVYEYVEPEALDTLIMEDGDVSVSFPVRDYMVEVADAGVTVYCAGSVGP